MNELHKRYKYLFEKVYNCDNYFQSEKFLSLDTKEQEIIIKKLQKIVKELMTLDKMIYGGDRHCQLA